MKRQRAFIPHDSDECPFDYLGFWNYGSYRGEWSGTSAWLADMPLPADVVNEHLVKPVPEPAIRTVNTARDAVRHGAVEPVVFLAPVATESGQAVLPLAAHGYDADPNFVAHIERGIPGGDWLITTGAVAKMKDEGHHAVLVYAVDGEARGLVAPIKRPAWVEAGAS